MRNFILCAVLLAVGTISCHKTKPGPITLLGIYTEDSPISGRSQLLFVSDSVVVLREKGSSVQDSFYYNISDGSIYLSGFFSMTPMPTRLDFAIIDERTIMIGPLFPGIPEYHQPNMIFRK